MVTQFKKDLEEAKKAEIIVYNFLRKNFPKCIVQNVSDIPYFYYLGDIRVITTEGAKLHIEVKNDSRIAETHNILCETEVIYNSHSTAGNMECNTDFYAVVSESENKIYFLDFKKLKTLSKYAPQREIIHPEQRTICKLVSLDSAERAGALLATINYGG